MKLQSTQPNTVNKTILKELTSVCYPKVSSPVCNGSLSLDGYLKRVNCTLGYAKDVNE